MSGESHRTKPIATRLENDVYGILERRVIKRLKLDDLEHISTYVNEYLKRLITTEVRRKR